MAEAKKKTVKATPEKVEEKPAKAKNAAPKKEEAKVEAKPVKAEKAEPVKAEKVQVKEASAFARDVRVTPRKVRLVVDLVRGKNVNEALAMLARVNRAASAPVIKVIKSAAANAVHNFNLDGAKLYIADIQAADGVRMKRFEPRGKGSSSPLIKRCSNITCTVKERA
jgi:large subunit ribosomal protein L22